MKVKCKNSICVTFHIVLAISLIIPIQDAFTQQQMSARKTIVFDDLMSITALNVSHDDRLLFVGGWKENETSTRQYIGHIYSIEKDRYFIQFMGHSGLITSACFSPDDEKIVTAGYPYTVWYWDVNSGEILRTIQTGLKPTPYNSGTICGLQYFQDGNRILTGDDMGNIFVWNLLTGRSIVYCNPQFNGGGLRQIKTINLFQNEEKILVSGGSTPAEVRSVKDGNYLYSVGANDIIIEPKEGYFLGTLQNNIYKYDIGTGKELGKIATFIPYSYGAPRVFSPDGKYLASSRNVIVDGAKRGNSQTVIDTESGRILCDLISSQSEDDCEPRFILFSPSGKSLCVVKGNIVYLYVPCGLTSHVDIQY